MPGVAFIPNTPDPGHPGRFLTPVRAPAGNVGGAFLPDVFGLSARQCVEAAFGADPFADPSAWAWVDITRYVQWDPGVDISIGYEDESVRLKPGSMTVKLRNDQAGGGYFTLDNDNSPFAPYVRENTPIRARLDVGGGWSLRFQGYATGWTPSRGPGGESWVSLQANGISRRKRQGRRASPKSAMRRSYDTDPTQPIEYWPLEGGKGRAVSYGVIANTPSAQGGFVSLVDGDAGAAQFGSVSLGDGSDDVVNIAGGWSLDLNMPYGTPATGTVVLEFSMAFGTTVRTGTTHTCGIRLNPYVAARHLAFNVNITDAGAVQLAWYEQDSGLNGLAGPTFIYNTGSENIFDGQPRVFQLWLLAYGSTDVDWALFENDELLSNGTITPSFAGAMNAAPWRSHSFSTASATATVALGHVAVWNTLPDVARYSPLIGWRGETPTARLARLCAEEGVPITIYGTSDLPMGPQGIEVFPDLLDAAAKTDQGSLFDGLGPGYTYILQRFVP